MLRVRVASVLRPVLRCGTVARRLLSSSEAPKNTEGIMAVYEGIENKRLMQYIAVMVGICAVQQLVIGDRSEAPPHHGHHTSAPAQALAQTPAQAPAEAAAEAENPSVVTLVSAEQAPPEPADAPPPAQSRLLATLTLVPGQTPGTPATPTPTPTPPPLPARVTPALPPPQPSSDVVSSPNGTFSAFTDAHGALWLRKGVGSHCQIGDATGAVPPAPLAFSPDDTWLVALSGSGELVAYEIGAPGGPTALTPPLPSKAVGQVMFGRGGDMLVEVGGLAPGAPALYRTQLPEPLHFDTSPPSVQLGGGVVKWLSETLPNGKVGACGAIVRNTGDETRLLLRPHSFSQMGNDAWRQTCERLKLPAPPIDPEGPIIFGEWEPIADVSKRMQVLGYRDGCAWLHDSASGELFALSIDSRPLGLRLREIPTGR